ncbi:MAG: proteasome lid subunit RPN8/RPN11 [Candidatus Marinamargulisbacteria bacterium]|jgi:proteasome lid subunit RPN8/RPN11
MITLSKTLLDEIKNHCRDAYPEECCGALIGSLDVDLNRKRTLKILRIENESKEDRHRRFSIQPEDYKNIEEYAKEEGLDLLGFYHSHPDHPAHPSDTDLKYAWPLFSYLIMSVMKGDPTQIASFQLDLDSNQFEYEKLVLEEGHSDLVA